MKKECTSLKNIIALQQNKIILNKERVQNEKDNQDKNLELIFKEKLGKLFSPTQTSMLWSNKSRVFAWTNDDQWRRTQFKMGWQTSKNLQNTHPPRTVKLCGHYYGLIPHYLNVIIRYQSCKIIFFFSIIHKY